MFTRYLNDSPKPIRLTFIAGFDARDWVVQDVQVSLARTNTKRHVVRESVEPLNALCSVVC